MSLPQSDEHTCQNCVKKVGVNCANIRKVKEGYCTRWVGVKP